MAEVHPGCRIRSVRDKKSGFTLYRMTDRTTQSRISFLQEMRSLVDSFQYDGEPIAGFAVVLWGADGASNATLHAGTGSKIPSIAMPEFVKNRLLAAKIQEWIA